MFLCYNCVWINFDPFLNCLSAIWSFDKQHQCIYLWYMIHFLYKYNIISRDSSEHRKRYNWQQQQTGQLQLPVVSQVPAAVSLLPDLRERQQTAAAGLNLHLSHQQKQHNRSHLTEIIHRRHIRWEYRVWCHDVRLWPQLKNNQIQDVIRSFL